MKQYPKTLIDSHILVMLLWGVTILCLVFAGAYTFRYRAFLNSDVCLDPNSLVQAEPNEAELKACVAEDQKIMEAVQAENLFVKAPPKTNPVNDVDIIGQEALINGQLYKVGDQVGDAKIVAITAESVTVEWNGTTTTFSPINGQDQGGGANGPGKAPGPANRPNRPNRAARSVSSPSSSTIARPSPEEITRIRNMPPEERRAFLEARRNSRR